MIKKIISITCFISLIMSQDIDPVFTGAFGSATINDEIYNQFSIRPEFSFSKLAVGLDVYFYFDADGNLYSENWDFSSSERSFKTLVDKIYYIRWGQEDDPLYFRIGALPTITLGHGSLVNSYSNVTDYPRVRRTGFNLKKQFNNYNLEIIHSNLKNIFKPAVFGIGNTLSFSNNLVLSVVGVTDFNQHEGLPDTDGDGYPNYLEEGFENDPDQWYEDQFFIEENKDLCYDPDYVDDIGTMVEGCDCFTSGILIPGCDSTANSIEDCLASGGQWSDEIAVGDGIADFCNYKQSESAQEQWANFQELKKNDSVSGLSVGLSYSLSNNMVLYSEFSQLFGDTKNPYSDNSNFTTKLGYGFIPLGLKVDLKILSLSVDFRQNSDNFIFNYWDRNYDHSRITVNPVEGSSNTLITKESELYHYGKSNGMHFTITSSALKFFNISLSYQQLNSDMWNSELEEYETDSNKSLYAKLDVDTSMIEKIRIAEIFYQRNHADDVFDSMKDENSLFGYNLGLQLSDNMVFILKARKTYALNESGDYESVKTTQFESQIIF